MMSSPDEFYEPEGILVPSESLTFQKAKGICAVLTGDSYPYARLRDCRKIGTKETLIFEVDVEVPQFPTHDIRCQETLAVTLDEQDLVLPDTLALRHSFPLVPHLNLRDYAIPKSLCLYDRAYRELKPHWSPVRYLEDVRGWLARTSKGSLHHKDQPLEPLIPESSRELIIPRDLFSEGLAHDLSHVGWLKTTAPVYMLQRKPPKYAWDGNDWRKVLVVSVECPPHQHGIIQKTPLNLLDVVSLLESVGVDLIGSLKRIFLGNGAERIAESRLLLLVRLPKLRSAGQAVETDEYLVFESTANALAVAAALGAREACGNLSGVLLGVPEDPKRLQAIGVHLYKPILDNSRELAARLNGLAMPDRRTITAIGLGALGSQVFLNLVRAGVGRWRLVDEDSMLPHNLARHALTRWSGLGYQKVMGLSVLVNDFFEDAADQPVESIECLDALAPTSQPTLDARCRDADIILDMSASSTVARHLAVNVEGAARRVSLHLNPTGTDLVCLVEDRARAQRLDLLEMQYIRGVANEGTLRDHFKPAEPSIRYSLSCRDLTAVLPQDLVALHAAIGSRAVRALTAHDGASINIWKASELLEVKVYALETSPTTSESVENWTIFTDAWLWRKIQNSREERLPNETGGILLGAVDHERKIVYVADTLLSPPDSQEWPTMYIRGCRGLLQQVQQYEERAGRAFHYLGEWHSHPRGFSTTPSADDLKVLKWLQAELRGHGVPALVLIQGEDDQHRWLVG